MSYNCKSEYHLVLLVVFFINAYFQNNTFCSINGGSTLMYLNHKRRRRRRNTPSSVSRNKCRSFVFLVVFVDGVLWNEWGRVTAKATQFASSGNIGETSFSIVAGIIQSRMIIAMYNNIRGSRTLFHRVSWGIQWEGDSSKALY